MSTKTAWDVTTHSTVPTSADTLDAAFAEITDQTRSSGWVCTLTIECGTVVCACE